MRLEIRSSFALGLSLLLHAAIFFLVAVGVTRIPPSRSQPAQPLRDSWVGQTVEVDELIRPAPKSVEPAPAPPRSDEPEASPEPAEPRPVEPPARATAAPPEPQPPVQPAPSPPATASAKPSASAAAEPADSASAEPAANPLATSAGARGLPPGVRHLAKAFTRAIPMGSQADPVWTRMALGEVGHFSVKIVIDDDGKLTAGELLEPADEVSAPLRRLFDRTLLLLKGGRFALSASEPKSGEERFRVDVKLSMGTPADDEFMEPNHPVELGFDAPAAQKPGRAFFRLASGRTLEARVTLLSSR